MKGKLIIKVSKAVEKTNYLLEEGLADFDYLIYITIPKNAKFDIKEIKTGFYNYTEKTIKSNQYDIIELIKQAYLEKIDLIDNCSIINIKPKNKKIKKKIENYFINKNRNIIIDKNIYQISKECLKEVESKYGNYNVFLKVEDNYDFISLKDYRKTVKIISNIIEKIKSFNFSPLEQIIYAYDYTRDRIYTKEKNNESKLESRDLTKVLLGDKIVCTGYAAIFVQILKGLGIQANKYIVKVGKIRHQIIIVRIIDKKYNINKIEYFDPTWDSKKDETNNHFNNYKHCCIYDINELYTDETFGNYSIDEYKKILTTLNSNSINYRKIKNLKLLYEFMNGRTVDVNYVTGLKRFAKNINKDDFMEKVQEYHKLCTILDNRILLEAIYNVRKIEYYENPSKYSLSILNFYQIIDSFDSYWNDDLKEKELYNIVDEKKADIERVRLTKVLSNIRNQKTYR